MDPSIKINKSNKSKVKNPPTDTPRVFGSITQNSMIFFVPSMQANNQLDTSYSFQFFKFKTFDNLIGWEPMPDNASPK